MSFSNFRIPFVFKDSRLSGSPGNRFGSQFNNTFGAHSAPPNRDISSPSRADSQMKDIFEDIATVGTNFEQQLRIKLDQDSRDINQNFNQNQPQSNVSQMIPMNNARRPPQASSVAQSFSPSSCPTLYMPVKQEMTDDEIRQIQKDRQKKDNHNLIERRRRYNINDRIKELGQLIPRSGDPEMRWNKGNILKAAVEHIRKLHTRQERQVRSDDRAKKMEAMNRQLMIRLQECENAMRSNGLDVPDMPERDEFIAQLGGNETGNMLDDDLESAPSPGDIMSLNDDLQSTHSMQSQNFMSSPRRIGGSEPKPMPGQPSTLQQPSSLNQFSHQNASSFASGVGTPEFGSLFSQLQELINDPSLQDVTDMGGQMAANQNRQAQPQSQARQAPEQVQNYPDPVHDMDFGRQENTIFQEDFNMGDDIQFD
ncbi:Oidioi.mRNA.OKI2018_I69.chr2.g6817.t3.cds [Oikopleura dioica]|uniref:Oidioi.mRNA.OKI2018_I69.chr2.g6817.t3.cds n=1 Tax=Oikopleura dioica TaxID=34765 RepID=A0ABN7TB13_OIKDI|nr:Oidioi.mRNA.OKI2018_I69.chr2.g6817.t3.cds [Oikopleura dioica]